MCTILKSQKNIVKKVIYKYINLKIGINIGYLSPFGLETVHDFSKVKKKVILFLYPQHTVIDFGSS